MLFRQVPMKFRYPFYGEIHWYVLERYVHSLTGVTFLEKPQLNDDLELITGKVTQHSSILFFNAKVYYFLCLNKEIVQYYTKLEALY